MARIGFFETLLSDDISFRERSAINSAQDSADAALHQGEMLGTSIGALQRTVLAQGRELHNLRAAIAVLVQTLADTGAVDAQVLDYRLEAALDEAEQESEAAPLVMCVGCSTQLAQDRTNVTELGLMCDRCFASR